MTSSYDKLSGQLFKAIIFLIPSGNCGSPPGVPAGVVCGSEPVVGVGLGPVQFGGWGQNPARAACTGVACARLNS